MFWTLFRKELLESWRTYRSLVLAVVLVAFGILSPVTARFLPEILKLAAGEQEGMEVLMEIIPSPTVTDAVDQYLSNLTQIVVLVLVLLVMGLVAREKDKGTLTMVLARPVSRTSFLLAKFGAFTTQLTLCLAAAGLACYLYAGLLFGEWLDLIAFLAINGLMLLYLLVPTALTFLGSALTRGSFAAAGIGLGSWLILGLLGRLHALQDYAPGRLVAAAATLARDVPFDAWWTVFASAGLIVLCLALSAIAFQRQEL